MSTQKNPKAFNNNEEFPDTKRRKVKNFVSACRKYLPSMNKLGLTDI